MLHKIGYFLLFFLAFGVALFSMRYWSFEVTDILHFKTEEVLANGVYRAAFYGHVIFGPIALMAGPFQFLPKFRNRNLKAHRLIGFVYIVACLLSGLAGLAAAQWTMGGVPAELGFSLLAIGWLYTTTKAWQNIRRKNVAGHQQWMLRSYALTLSAVTLRLWSPLLGVFFGLSFLEAYPIVAWLCWVPNIVVIEWWIRRNLAIA